MAHLLTIQDIKNERSRLLNSIEILPMSYRFTDAEKTALLEIYKVQLALYDTAIARNIEVSKNFAIIVSKEQLNEAFEIDFKIMLINGKPNTGKSTFAKRIAEKFNDVLYLDGNNIIANHFIFNEAKSSTDLVVADDVCNLRAFEYLIFNYFSEPTLEINKKGYCPFKIKTPKLIIVAQNHFKIEHFSEHLKSRILIINM